MLRENYAMIQGEIMIKNLIKGYSLAGLNDNKERGNAASGRKDAKRLRVRNR